MMNTILERISIRNFKGISELHMSFTKNNYIYGANASGKTTIMDAFTWLLFGKDSHGKSDFQIRPVDENGKTIDGVDIEVEGTLKTEFKDGAACDIVFKKIQKQNWVKKRGTEAPIYQGDTNVYFINDYDVSQRDYNAKVASVIDEKLFKLLTDPKTFSSMDWRERREMLLRFVPNLTDQSILDGNMKDYGLIAKDILEAGVDKAKDKVSKDIKLLNKTLDEFPTRIDEVARAIRPTEHTLEQAELQKMAIGSQIKQLQADKDSIRGQVDGYEELSNQILQLVRKKDAIKREAQAGLDAQKREARRAMDEAGEALLDNKVAITKHSTQVKILQSALANSEAELKDVTDKWRSLKRTELPEEETICPTCGRPFETDQIEKLRQDFDAEKESKLTDLQEQGVELRRKVNQIKADINVEQLNIDTRKAETEKLGKAVEILKDRYDALPLTADMSENEDYQACETSIKELISKQEGMKADTSAQEALAERENALRSELDAINAEIVTINSNVDLKARIAELQESQINTGQMITGLEHKLYLLEKYAKEKMNILSGQINDMFEFVHFRLFDQQKNGAIKENCVMQVNSNGSYVDYPNANSAAQIQGGLDVIRALSKLYDVTCPLFIDNRESCTEIPQMNAQVINLVVSPADKTLRLESK